MASVRVLERIVRNAPFGVRLWDLATATHLVEGLEVDVVERTWPESRSRAFMNRSGIYCALDIPGLRRFESPETDDPAVWTAMLRRYRIEVKDPLGRFLPFAFDTDLPSRGLLNGLPSWNSPPLLPDFLAEPGSPPQTMIGAVPLFSAPSRRISNPVAVIQAQLKELGTDKPAAWCLLIACIAGVARGIGLADAEGRVVILFPYPDRLFQPRSSPPMAINDFVWNVELTAYYSALGNASPPATPTLLPNLTDVFDQFNQPRTLFLSTASPPQPLPALPLQYRVPLTVRTTDTPDGPSSFLFVNTA